VAVTAKQRKEREIRCSAHRVSVGDVDVEEANSLLVADYFHFEDVVYLSVDHTYTIAVSLRIYLKKARRKLNMVDGSSLYT